MKSVSGSLAAAALVFGLAFAGAPTMAQQAAKPSEQGAIALKPATPAALAAAKEILAMKSVSAMYGNAVPNIVARTKTALIQNNLNYQKDLNEVAVIVAKNLSGRESEIGDGFAQIYANVFTEQELKDLVTFYKSPLGQKLIANEPRAVESSMAYMNKWASVFAEAVNEQFRAEMKKRGKDI